VPAGPAALREGPLREAVLGARLDIADALSAAIAAGRLGPRTYLRWIAGERVLCQAGALALESMADRLPGGLDPWMTAAEGRLRDQAAMAGADVRRTMGMAPAPSLPALEHWQDYYELHARHRPGRVLGAIALHDAAMGGPARDALAAVLELPFLAIRGATYLLHRRLHAESADAGAQWLWRSLPSPAMQDDLLAGAIDAAGLYRGMVRDIAGEAAPGGRWHWPESADGAA
jgi:hypothetical protein